MKSRQRNRFSKLMDRKDTALAENPVDAVQPVVSGDTKKKGVLEKRQATIQAVVSGKSRNVRQIHHNPERIRAWSGHNRQYHLLSENRCADLIEGFKRVGQQFPIIVRTIEDDPDFDYEFICGARRHWTASHLDIDVLAEVRTLSDRDAFLLQDIENREREDISDYERACDYAKALPIYFDGNKKRMAEELKIDRSNFAKFLMLAEVPPVIVDLYSDQRDLIRPHATVYHKWFSEPAQRKKLLTAARKREGQGGNGKELFAYFKKAMSSTQASKPRPTTSKTFGRLTLQTKASGQCVVAFDFPQSEQTKGIVELRSDFQKLLASLDVTQTGK